MVGENLPDADIDFSCKSSDPPQEPDAVVDVRQNTLWVRIPVVSTELWVDTDGPADITRTAKVETPAEWGDESISQYINGFTQDKPKNDAPPYDECRIFLRDQYEDTWRIAHFGYIGGVGPSSQNGVLKFWVYDPADLLKGINVSKSFGEPQIADILNFAVQGSNSDGTPVGIRDRSVFRNVSIVVDGEEERATTKFDLAEAGFDILTNVNPIATIYDAAEQFDNLGKLVGGQRRFQRNRHNMVDVLNWFAGEVGGKWHFHPQVDGTSLVFENPPEDGIARRTFADASIPTDVEALEDRTVFAEVDTLNNQALVDIKPFNTLVVNGETKSATRRDIDAAVDKEQDGDIGPGVAAATWLKQAAAPGVTTQVYPYVKLVYEPLLQSAGGYEYSAPVVNSDAVTKDQALQHGVRAFRDHLAESTEGSIELKGDPHILPNDQLLTIPVCNDIYTNANAAPILYEVNSVKHETRGGERYTTDLGVSLTFDESQLNKTVEYREL